MEQFEQDMLDDAKSAGASIFDGGRDIVIHGKYGSGDGREFLIRFTQLQRERQERAVKKALEEVDANKELR